MKDETPFAKYYILGISGGVGKLMGSARTENLAITDVEVYSPMGHEQ